MQETLICWNCAAAIDAERVAVEAILHPRSAAQGGPFQSVKCRQCGTDNGVLLDERLGGLLYPLVGQQDPTLADWIVPQVSLTQLQRARTWWRRNRDRVERFQHAMQEPQKAGRRRARPGRGAGRATGDPPPRERRTKRATPRPEPPPPPPPPPSPEPEPEPAAADPVATPAHPREVLGIDESATREELQRAFRERLKRCHPDLVANLDEEFQALAHRKAKELRAAYEFLLAEYDAREAG